MNVIVLEEEAFYKLIEEVVGRIKAKQKNITEDKWITPEAGMKKLGIKSKTTLQKLRDEGRIRFSQPDKRIILYDTDSIYQYLSKHSKDTF